MFTKDKNAHTKISFKNKSQILTFISELNWTIFGNNELTFLRQNTPNIPNITALINKEGVCRTDPAMPGLLKCKIFTFCG